MGLLLLLVVVVVDVVVDVDVDVVPYTWFLSVLDLISVFLFLFVFAFLRMTHATTVITMIKSSISGIMRPTARFELDLLSRTLSSIELGGLGLDVDSKFTFPEQTFLKLTSSA